MQTCCGRATASMRGKNDDSRDSAAWHRSSAKQETAYGMNRRSSSRTPSAAACLWPGAPPPICSPGRTRTSNLLITRSPKFPSDVDYLIALARLRTVGTGRLVSEPSRGVPRAWLRIAIALARFRFPAIHPVFLPEFPQSAATFGHSQPRCLIAPPGSGLGHSTCTDGPGHQGGRSQDVAQ